MRADLVSRRSRGLQRPRCDCRLPADDEERGAHSRRGEQLAEALDADGRDGALRPLVEAQRQTVDGGVAAEPVQIDGDRPDHGVRRDSSCR